MGGKIIPRGQEKLGGIRGFAKKKTINPTQATADISSCQPPTQPFGGRREPAPLLFPPFKEVGGGGAGTPLILKCWRGSHRQNGHACAKQNQKTADRTTLDTEAIPEQP